MSRRLISGIAILATAAALTACSSENGTTEDTATESSAASTAASSESSAEDTTTEKAAEQDIMFEEPVVRAMEAGKGMTGMFGTLVNNTDKDINIVEFETDLGAKMYELHEVIDGVMMEKPGGFVVPANGTYELKPGADHFMIMGFDEAIEAGDTIGEVVIKDVEGNTYDFKDVPVRTLLPGDENYGGDGSLEGHNPEEKMTHDMGEMEGDMGEMAH
ncbi:copper chaperone PCu(A)C [Corynebacterium breve]|uniref:Copper chaperone PCu(A)C n=1 Tax=Corynebacterium breve TaxID=3049799 RepID=A0ABY8VJX6_9CORY|nr:copper chaperone PCu(A)C [Corynebacterium breve]WIM68963.1 copper chaperone PCu(A)C [Corynebacterium breve]